MVVRHRIICLNPDMAGLLQGHLSVLGHCRDFAGCCPVPFLCYRPAPRIIAVIDVIAEIIGNFSIRTNVSHAAVPASHLPQLSYTNFFLNWFCQLIIAFVAVSVTAVIMFRFPACLFLMDTGIDPVPQLPHSHPVTFINGNSLIIFQKLQICPIFPK